MGDRRSADQPGSRHGGSTFRSYHHRDFSEAQLLRERHESVSICLPAREEAGTIGPIVETLVALRERGVVDEVVVVDGGSQDGTREIAAGSGADVHHQDSLMPQLGPALGKGDAMWRALSVLEGEVVCYVDADSEGFGSHFACGLIGPLICEPGFASGGRVHETPVEKFDEQLRLNLRAGYLVWQAAIPHLLEAGGGAIVCVSSRAALQPFAGASGYVVSKAAVLAFTDLLAVEYRQDGIRANAVLPSVIDTPANRSAVPDADHSRWVQPQQIAEVIHFLCGEGAEAISGARVPVYGRA